MEKPVIYMAGPMDRPDDDGRGWRNFVSDTYRAIEWKNPLDMHDPRTNPAATDRQIVREDKEQIRESNAMLIVIPSLNDLSWGTQQEQVLMRTGVLGTNYRGPTGSGAPRPTMNAVVYAGDHADLSPWCRHHADHIATTIEEGVEWLYEMLTHDHYPPTPVSILDPYMVTEELVGDRERTEFLDRAEDEMDVLTERYLEEDLA